MALAETCCVRLPHSCVRGETRGDFSVVQVQFGRGRAELRVVMFTFCAWGTISCV